MKSIKRNLTFWIIAILTFVHIILGVFYFNVFTYILSSKMVLLAFLGLSFLLILRKSLVWYSAVMLVGNTPFSKKVDRPRVFFFSLFYSSFLLIFLAFYKYMGEPLESNLTWNLVLFYKLMLSVFLFLGGLVFLLLTFVFSKKFESFYLPELKNASQILEGSKGSLKKKMTEERAKEVFDNLKNCNYVFLEGDLEKEKLQRNMFVRLFSSDRSKSKLSRYSKTQKRSIADDIPLNPIVKLLMTNVEVKIFFEYLMKETKLFHYYELAEIFGDENGDSFNYNSLSTSAGDAKGRGTYDAYEEKVSEIFLI